MLSKREQDYAHKAFNNCFFYEWLKKPEILLAKKVKY